MSCVLGTRFARRQVRLFRLGWTLRLRAGPKRLPRARAIGQTAVLFGSHGKYNGAPVALPDAKVKVMLRFAESSKNTVYEVSTDEQGAFAIDLGELPDGTVLEFLAVIGEDKPAEAAAYYAKSWEVGEKAWPKELQFFQVMQDPEPLVMVVTRVLTTQERTGPGDLEIRLRQNIQLMNYSFGVWLGDVDADRRVSFYLPVPHGFEVRAIQGVATSAGFGPRICRSGHGRRHRSIFPTAGRTRSRRAIWPFSPSPAKGRNWTSACT